MRNKPLAGKTVLITAGPTREYIDPVRFISNASSGRMGFMLAEEAYRLGGRVFLITGPTSLVPHQRIVCIPVVTALQMQKEVERLFPQSDIIVGAAAVSDYRPIIVRKKKIKKNQTYRTLRLIKNPDILGLLGKRKGSKKLIGFALETDNLISSAIRKKRQKNLDVIFANPVTNIQKTNACGYVIGKRIIRIPRCSKHTLARLLWKYILQNQTLNPKL